jgi:hypothetical protein
MIVNIGKLRRVPLREVWRHEARDFTGWLQDNIDVLNDQLGLQLLSVERERSAGDFSVDLVAEDSSGNPVIIENQLERSDHDHLGKVLTYLVAMEAHAAVWIVAKPRPEHIAVINWLNESTSGSFYLVQVEAIRVDDSPAAPLLTLIVGPSIEGRQVGQTKKALAERHILRQAFWESLLDKMRPRSKLFSGRTGSKDYWISTGAGRSGLEWIFVILKEAARVELAINTSDPTKNFEFLDSLRQNRQIIEAAFGSQLIWASAEGQRACYVRQPLPIGGYRNDREDWPAIQDQMITAMIRLEETLRPYLRKL